MNDSQQKIPEKNEEEEKKDDLKNRLIKSKDMRKNIKRELTGHVVTRWYRAPEIILLESLKANLPQLRCLKIQNHKLAQNKLLEKII